MLQFIKRVLPALAYHPSAFPGSKRWAEETIQVKDLPEHKIPFPSNIRKDVALAWPVVFGYFPLKLILFQKTSLTALSLNLKIFCGADLRICQTCQHVPNLGSKHRVFFTKILFFSKHKKATGGLSYELTIHCQPRLYSSNGPDPGQSCHSLFSA